jgi:hypothetical protein
MGYELVDDVAEPEVVPDATALSDDDMDLLAELVDASELEATTGAVDS